MTTRPRSKFLFMDEQAFYRRLREASRERNHHPFLKGLARLFTWEKQKPVPRIVYIYQEDYKVPLSLLTGASFENLLYYGRTLDRINPQLIGYPTRVETKVPSLPSLPSLPPPAYLGGRKRARSLDEADKNKENKLEQIESLLDNIGKLEAARKTTPKPHEYSGACIYLQTDFFRSVKQQREEEEEIEEDKETVSLSRLGPTIIFSEASQERLFNIDEPCNASPVPPKSPTKSCLKQTTNKNYRLEKVRTQGCDLVGTEEFQRYGEIYDVRRCHLQQQFSEYRAHQISNYYNT